RPTPNIVHPMTFLSSTSSNFRTPSRYGAIGRWMLSVGCWMFCLFIHAEPPSRIVMTWIPPYSIDKCRTRLQQDVDGLGPKDALTHLGLQFWVPTRGGSVAKAPHYKIDDSTITAIRDWAHQNHIQLMLCVYNYVDSWDWPLAESAFGGHRED